VYRKHLVGQIQRGLKQSDEMCLFCSDPHLKKRPNGESPLRKSFPTAVSRMIILLAIWLHFYILNVLSGMTNHWKV